MKITLEEKLAALPAERRKRIEAESERIRQAYLTLKELRKARTMTQARLAEELHVNQVSIAKLEKRSDLLLSTLRGYVEGLGGELDLVVRFPGHPDLHLNGIGETEPSG
ncbi:helix-turn-helix domain-containing protein [Pararhizobium mangrovi]|uniref:Helix-turn-helix transcriptional regulator n=1 Tax=Pararhizobium mangrovi TaxID=2590452 RepID=A0A506TX57_9HYPH|nr:helix-turn-helix domain-containing protein [Pararhizobium mangrovi]TPW26622.1 helix-turn-helix transcriptional regulator [Pararhizobium mangrovi]